MKGIIKAVIAGSVIIAIGIAILVIALALNGWTISQPKFEMKRYEATEENTSLKVEFGAGSLKTVYYDGEKIAVEYPEARGYVGEITEKDGKLSFKTRSKILFINIGRWNVPDTVIYLPKNVTYDIDFKLGAGSVELVSGNYGEVKIEVGAGMFTAAGLYCDNIDAKVSAGMLEITSAECNVFDAKVSAGKLNIASAFCNTFNGKVSAGKLSASSLSAEKISANVSAGSLELRVSGALTEYSVSTSVSAGSCNLSDRTGTTDKKIDAKVSAGSLNITFTD